MAVAPEPFIAEIDGLLQRVGLPPGSYVRLDYFRDTTGSERAGLVASYAAAIERLTPPGSQYRELLANILARYNDVAAAENLAALVGLLNTVRNDYSAGYLRSVVEVVHADVFADFLEMAAELLDKSYKDAAAVITGSVLEEHLRKLSDAAGLAVSKPDGKPRKADTLNADLVKAGTYNKLEQKQVTAWLDLRNKAAHGQYDEYDRLQVAQMLEGVRAFLVRHPA